MPSNRLFGVAALALLAPTCLGATMPVTRHLKYAFGVNWTWQTSQSPGDFSGPDSGTVDVTLLPASDGGTIVQATEQWWNRVRPEQPITCELHPNASLNCNQLPGPSLIELALLPLLAPKFFEHIDASTWVLSYDVALPKADRSLTTSASLRVQKWSGPVAQVELEATSRQIDGPRNEEKQHAAILFDRTSSLPVSIHERWSETSLESGGDATVDLKLLKDYG